jgi:YjbE family integral membrane protein
MAFEHLFTPSAISAFFAVVMIDLALAGDNAVAVGMAAAGLHPEQRRKAIIVGLAAAVVMRVTFSLITVRLLQIVGLLVCGGFLLLWVCWRMWKDLRQSAQEAEAALYSGAPAKPAPPVKTFRQALIQILVADLAMSLDNVLAVAGAARQHPGVLIIGLMLSVTLTGLAANWIAQLLQRMRWIGFVGLAIILYVAVHMIWEGARTVAIDLHKTHVYNAAMPGKPLDIKPAEIAKRRGD